MKNLLVLALLTGILLVSAGCDLSGGPPDYFPLTAGNRWEYAELELRVTPDSTDTLSRETVTIELPGRTRLASGDSAWVVVTTQAGSADTTFYRETDGRVLSYEDPDDDEPVTFLSLPLEQDATWWVDEDIYARVVGKEALTVAAGRYKDCWKITWFEDGDTLFHYWLAPDVGIALFEEESEVSGVRYVTRRELTSADLK